MAYIGSVSAFESVGTSELEDGSVTTAKLNAAVANAINPSLGTASIIRTNANTISENITIPANTNGMSAGPITIADGNTVTVSGTWSIV